MYGNGFQGLGGSDLSLVVSGFCESGLGSVDVMAVGLEIGLVCGFCESLLRSMAVMASGLEVSLVCCC